MSTDERVRAPRSVPRSLIAAAIGLVALGVWGIVALTGGDASAAHGNHDHAAHSHGDHHHGPTANLAIPSRFTDQGFVWPPRVDGAGSPRAINRWDEPQYEADPIVERILQDAAVAEALGEDWTVLEIETARMNGKGAVDHGRGSMTLFSRTNNQSVRLETAGAAVLGLEMIAPQDAQLALAPSEVADSVDIARAYWLEQGEGRVNDLEGFAILAFTPDDQFFDVRMAYVSLHIDADARPEFVAYVDLTNGVVVDAWREG